MNYKRGISVGMIFISLALTVLSCSHYDMGKAETKISKMEMMKATTTVKIA